MAKARTRRPKKTYLPDMEPESIPELDSAADIYYDAMQERVRLSKEEDEAKDNLIDKMKEHGLTLYETREGLIVSILNKSNVRCKRKKEASEESNGEADA